MSDIQSFRDAIEAFISARGWTTTRFGRQMAGEQVTADTRDQARRDSVSASVQRMRDSLERQSIEHAPFLVTARRGSKGDHCKPRKPRASGSGGRTISRDANPMRA